ncbi:Conserved_hypothetical protein [Hexamita inflata]|uniref:Uncharacterized protein n=1 Tax=Hexamita inflata TaxID=28002 RepID=A0AA86NJM9_9EUKA|nr:Conserved hypothetical protein [Hexamita inflata]
MSNPLWLSAQSLDLNQTIENAKVALSAFQNGQYTVSNIMKVPFIYQFLFFAILPLVGAVIGIIFCCPTCFCACCCNAYARYHRKNKKLQKHSIQLLKSQNVQKKGLPSDVAIKSSKLDKADRRELYQQSKILIPIKQKIFQKSRCAKCCWLSWFGFAFLYFLSIIYVILGVKSILTIPQQALTAVGSQANSLQQVLEHGAVSIDNVLNNFTSTPHNITQKIIAFKDFETDFAAFKTDFVKVQPIKDLIDKGVVFAEKLVEFVSKSLMYETGSDQNAIMSGVATFLANGLNLTLDQTNQILSQFNTIISTPDLPSTLRDQLQSQTVPDIDINTLLGGYSDIINLLASKTATKWQFANKLETIISNMMAGLDNLLALIIYKDENGTSKNVSVKTIMAQYGFDPDAQLASISNMVSKQLVNIHDLIVKFNSSGYISILRDIQKLTVSELVTQLQTPKDSNCTQIWCGMISQNMISDQSANLQQIVPSFLKSIVSFDSYDSLMSKLNPILYGLILGIPLLILIISFSCVLCRKTCCTCCSIACCPVCSLCTSIFGIVLLVMSIIPSIMFGTVTTQIQSNFTNIGNIGLSQSQQMNFVQDTMEITLPQISFVEFLPQKLQLNLSSIDGLFKSISVDMKIQPISLNLNMDIPLVTSILGQSIPQIITKVTSYINDAIKDTITISLEKTDISDLMNSNKNSSILAMISINNMTLGKFIIDKLDIILTKFLSDQVPLIYAAINTTQALQAVQSLDLQQLIIDQMGINLSSIIETTVQTPVSSALSSAYCALKPNVDKVTPKANLIQLFSSVSNAFDTFTPSSPPSITIPPIASTDGLQTLQSLILTLYLEAASDNNFLPSVLGSSPATSTDVQTDATLFIENKIYTGIELNRNIGTILNSFVFSPGVDTDFNQFAQFYDSSCPTQSQYDQMNNAINSGTPQMTDILVVPNRFYINLISRKQLTSIITRPTAISDPQFNDYVKAAYMYFYYCKYINQALSFVKVLENETVTYSQAVYRLSQMSNVYFQISDVMTNINSMNDNLFGQNKIDCSGTGAPVSSFLSQLTPKLFVGAKSLLTNIIQQLEPGKLFQNAFITSQLFSSIKQLLIETLTNAFGLLFGENSFLSSKLFGIIPDTMNQMMHVALGWSNSLSFATYLSFLFAMLGPMCLAFAYKYIKLDQSEKKWKRKYGAIYDGITFKKQEIKVEKKDKKKRSQKDYEDSNDDTSYVTQLGISDRVLSPANF